MAGDPQAISMTVLRDGYWAGTYARPGDIITVDAEAVKSLGLAEPREVVEALEGAGFARRRAPEAPRETGRKAHGR
jgi:hypothetical protein